MSIDTENMKNTMNSLVYEQPTLKNYGTMKSLTLGLAGSPSDAIGMSDGGNSPLSDNATNDFGGSNSSDFPADVHNGTGFQSDPDS
ncbi:hypothetical protein [Moorena producens]|uniref:hypothetical protein n=1 Tax=Moorena producens TaxID=1155739 RepID=UPI003C789F62